MKSGDEYVKEIEGDAGREIRESRAMECLAELEGVAWAMSRVFYAEVEVVSSEA